MMNSCECESAYVWENPACPAFIPGKAKIHELRREKFRVRAGPRGNGNNPDGGRVSAYEQVTRDFVSTLEESDFCVDVHVGRLRTKVAALGVRPVIQTVRGSGYRFG